VIPLEVSFKIPSFHRTIATEKGEIYVIGGTSADTLKRTKDIYQYNKSGKTLLKVAELLVARSSHSVLCHQGLIYISGGMTNNDETLKKCEIFLPRTNEIKAMASCKYETTNSCLCAIGNDSLLKFGGVHASGENNNTLEVYSIRNNLWTEVDPIIEHQGEFGLLSCSGWAPLNESQVFVFGGYNEEIESENSRMSFVIERTHSLI
jgi:N-acetylneuraminic acid mutarotase